MIFRQLTGSGDWTFGAGVSGYATDNNAIELNIQTRLLSWKNDCFFALDDCVDWLGRLDKGQFANLNQELQQVILASFGVVSIQSFTGQLDDATRHYTGQAIINTIFSQGFILNLDLSAGIAPGS